MDRFPPCYAIQHTQYLGAHERFTSGWVQDNPFGWHGPISHSTMVRRSVPGISAALVTALPLLLVLSACRDISQPALDRSNNPGVLLPAEQNGQWGYVTDEGNFAIDPQYDRVHRFSDNRALVRQNNRFGFIDTSGHTIVSPTFVAAKPFSEGLAPVRPDSLWGYIDRDGEFVIQPRFRSAGPFRDGIAQVQLQDGTQGYVTAQDSLLWPQRE